MKPSEIRKQLHNYIDIADVETLNYVQEAIAAYKVKKRDHVEKEIAKARENIVPMTKESFFSMVDEAEENIKNGNIFTQAEVEEMMKKRHARL